MFRIIMLLLFLTGCSSQERLVNSDWYEVNTDHFRIVTNNDVELVVELAQDLEKFRLSLGALASARLNERDKLTIYAASDGLTYKALVGTEKGKTTNGLFRATTYGDLALLNMNGYSYTEKSKSYWAKQFLFHEYTHYVQRAGSALEYPYWYAEGYAEFVSTVKFKDNTIRLGEIPIDRAFRLVASSPMDLRELLTAKRGKLTKREVDKLYATGWLLTHMLSIESEYRSSLRPYLIAQAKTRDDIKVFEESFGTTIDEMQEELDRYFRRGRIKSYDIIYKAGFPKVNVDVKAIEKAEALSNLGQLFALSNDNTNAIENLKRVLSDEEIKATSLNYSLALARLKENRFEEADELMQSLPAKQVNKPWPAYVKAEWLRKNVERFPEKRKEYLTEAYHLYKRLLENDKQNAALWYGVAMCASQLMVKPSVYARYFEQAYFLNMRNQEVFGEYISALAENEDWRTLLTVVKPAINQTSDPKLRIALASYISYAEKNLERMEKRRNIYQGDSAPGLQ